MGKWKIGMYKIKNGYKNCHIMDLNLMEATYYRRNYVSGIDVFILLLPSIILLVALGIVFAPEMEFFAECLNVPGGDICHISVK